MTEQRTPTALILSVSNATQSLAASLDAIDALLRAWRIDPGDAAQVMIIVDEVAANIIGSAWPGDPAPHQFTLEIRIETTPGLRLDLLAVDDGVAFDPTCVPPPDLDAELDAREAGGLGLFMVKEMSDTVEYARVDDRNRLRITKRLRQATPGPGHTPE